MAMRPEVLVLDEPAAGLDPRGRSEILGGICQYQRESGTTVVIVSHSMEDMAKYCDEIFVMSHSKLILHGDCKEVFSQSDLLHSAGLDVPEISGLIRALRKKDVDISKYIYTVDGAVEEICKYVRGDQDGI
jgi:energy-coupling factor transport system ATP-binding protein